VRRLWREDDVHFTGAHFRLAGATISPKPVQAELPMWIGGSSAAAIRRTARFGTGWIAGAESPAEVAPIVAAIRAAAVAAGRAIDDGHYGAGFPFRFGRPDDAALTPAIAAYRKRKAGDPFAYVAVGGAAAILERIADYVAAGASKLILRPLARGTDDMLAQTRLLLQEVLPQVVARWPKPN
jgi:alkanesulfonate monooxygenase SsuD/methylene tetrahydromethanopterin reductase-like flavin-dependent oxidoreductase (luciferase family)